MTSALYFPPGLPERKGSCAFASMRCLVNCLSYLTHNTVTDNTVQIFKNKPSKTIANIIFEEIKDKNPLLVEWFCWGDCMPDMTDKVLTVMKLLSNKNVIQYGFTRNRKLWDATLKIQNTRIGFTEEDWNEVGKLAMKGLVAFPRYDIGVTQLYLRGEKPYQAGSCGSSFMQYHATKIVYDADCSECYKNKRGCFTRFEVIR